MDQDELRAALQRFMTDKQVEDWIKKEENRNRNLVQGDNVIDVNYSEAIVSEVELLEVKNELQAIGLDLSFYTLDGQILAHAAPPDPTAASIVFDLTKEIVLYPAATAILAKLGLLMWERCRKTRLYRVTSSEATPYTPETAIFVRLSKGKAIKYSFPNDLPKKVVEKALNNILEASKPHQAKEMKYYRLQRNGNWKPSKPFRLSGKRRKKVKNEIKGVIRFNRSKEGN